MNDLQRDIGRPTLRIGEFTILAANDAQAEIEAADLVTPTGFGGSAAILSGSLANFQFSISTTTTATASAAYAPSGAVVQLSATVAPTSGSIPDNETVNFTIKQGNTVVGSTSGLTSGGQATATYTLPPDTPAGTGYTVIASYVGDGTYAASDDSASPASFSVSAAPVAFTAPDGQPNVITLTSGGGYLLLSDNGGPATSYRLDSITDLTINGGDGNDTLVIDNTGGQVTLPAGGILFDGQGGTDGISVIGGTYGTVKYDISGTGAAPCSWTAPDPVQQS